MAGWRPELMGQAWTDGAIRFGGSMVALATPFRDGELDLPALAVLCQRQVLAGSAALVVCGTTGEAPALSISEQAVVVRVAVRAVAEQGGIGRVPVIAGCTAPGTHATTLLAEAMASAGASALLCAPPPYVKPTQDGIAAHMRAVFHATDLPILAYDVPARTGVAIADATVARLFDAGLIAGLKDATGDMSRPSRLRALCGGELAQLSGDDATSAAHLAMGGDGCISVTANVTPSLCAQMHAAWVRGDRARFGQLRDLLAPLHAALFLESNPIPLKAALAMLLLCESEMRSPLTRATPVTQQSLMAVLAGLSGAEAAAAARPLLQLVG